MDVAPMLDNSPAARTPATASTDHSTWKRDHIAFSFRPCPPGGIRACFVPTPRRARLTPISGSGVPATHRKLYQTLPLHPLKAHRGRDRCTAGRSAPLLIVLQGCRLETRLYGNRG